MNVWDIGGARKIRPYWRNYFENTDLLVSTACGLSMSFENLGYGNAHFFTYFSKESKKVHAPRERITIISFDFQVLPDP